MSETTNAASAAATFDLTGWTFGDANAVEWQAIGDGVSMKMLATADGTAIALFRFEPGYRGTPHHHEQAEFSYVLEGTLLSNGVVMPAGQAYAAQAGTDHEEFGTDEGAVIVSVFRLPS
ncbi:MAG: cupin domain-containing protein [Actinomycetota bacterium]